MTRERFNKQFARQRAKPKEGWLMSEAQAAGFWRLWAAVMRAQGWPSSENNQRRHEVLASLGFASIKDVDMKDGFDRVKKRLEELADKVHNERIDEGQRRRFLHRIEEQRVTLVALMGSFEASSYLAVLWTERFKRFAGVNVVEDLPTVELMQVVMTLDRVIKQQMEAAPEPAQEDDPF